MTDSNDQQPKKKKKGDILLTLVLIIAICVFCFAAYNLYHIYTEYKKGSDEYNKISLCYNLLVMGLIVLISILVSVCCNREMYSLVKSIIRR